MTDIPFDQITQITHSHLGIKIPVELRERLKQAAKAEGRSESSFARYYLAKAAEEILSKEEGAQ